MEIKAKVLSAKSENNTSAIEMVAQKTALWLTKKNLKLDEVTILQTVTIFAPDNTYDRQTVIATITILYSTREPKTS